MRKTLFITLFLTLVLFSPAADNATGDMIFTEDIKNYLKLGVWVEHNEFGLRVGNRVIRQEVYTMSTYEYTRGRNKIDIASHFTYEGTDVEENRVKIKYHFMTRKLQRSVWPGGEYDAYATEVDVWMDINPVVEDGKFVFKPIIEKTDKGYEPMPEWWIDLMLEQRFELFDLIARNERPGQQTEIILRWPLKITNLGRHFNDVLLQTFCVASLRDSGVLREKDVRFDDKGVWFVFSYDPEHFNMIHDLVFRNVCSAEDFYAGEN